MIEICLLILLFAFLWFFDSASRTITDIKILNDKIHEDDILCHLELSVMIYRNDLYSKQTISNFLFLDYKKLYPTCFEKYWR